MALCIAVDWPSNVAGRALRGTILANTVSIVSTSPSTATVQFYTSGYLMLSYYIMKVARFRHEPTWAFGRVKVGASGWRILPPPPRLHTSLYSISLPRHHLRDSLYTAVPLGPAISGSARVTWNALLVCEKKIVCCWKLSNRSARTGPCCPPSHHDTRHIHFRASS